MQQAGIVRECLIHKLFGIIWDMFAEGLSLIIAIRHWTDYVGTTAISGLQSVIRKYKTTVEICMLVI